jgi:hypothetical protein
VANGCHAKSEFPGVTYSSASENEYFGWTDATSDDARKLAVKFVDRFPEITGYGSGRDWASDPPVERGISIGLILRRSLSKSGR